MTENNQEESSTRAAVRVRKPFRIVVTRTHFPFRQREPEYCNLPDSFAVFRGLD
jgi:hypothetical protein